MSKISLCCITGNEEVHVERFLDSFAPAFDELCLVRAVGSLPHDATLSVAKRWCERNKKEIKLGTYENSPACADWPHVDDFAAARNMAWGMATGQWQFWADLDDVLAEGADMIRLGATLEHYSQYYFKYQIGAESNFRERMFRVGQSRWSQPLHENCLLTAPASLRGCYEPKVVFSHAPEKGKVRDPMRNTRIMRHHVQYLTGFAYGLHQEAFYRWCEHRKPEDYDEAIRWAEIAKVAGIAPETRLQLALNLSELIGVDDPRAALDIVWGAIRQAPNVRDGWGRAAELELAVGEDLSRAALASEIMQVMPKPKDSGFPRNDRFYGHEGLTLRTRTLRACGREELARRSEAKVFEANGARFSLLHATRGRPEQALKTRDLFIKAAFAPLGVEHIFAIDADDAESIAALRHYRHVIVDQPNGCVKAWNCAAADSTGQVLVQLSDDWEPCVNWDELCWLMLADEAAKKPCKVGELPAVLAVDDGTRRDALLCMAILTRARYEQQGREMFSPEYFGVFSDNEFTVRAYDAGVVIQARHIIFKHNHPIFAGLPPEQWDETHRRQNAPERYAQGVEVFNRRNPRHAVRLA